MTEQELKKSISISQILTGIFIVFAVFFHKDAMVVFLSVVAVWFFALATGDYCGRLKEIKEKNVS